MKFSTAIFQGLLLAITVPGLMASPTQTDSIDTGLLQKQFNNGKFLECVADFQDYPVCILALNCNADDSWSFRNPLAQALAGNKCDNCHCLD
ncbi:MAG: hypothetical protein M1838_005627 [Thelocarpon superellum]|nr:MAG: hypothetical protein M1838_005627 [Thelocarpon superellum]